MLQKIEAEGKHTFEIQKQLAQYFYKKQNLDKAVTHLKKAIDIADSSFDHYERSEMSYQLLNIYLKQDREDLVLAFYENEASKQNPPEVIYTTFSSVGISITFGGDDTRETLIDFYKDRGQLEELRTHFERKLEEDAANPAILELLAEIYWEISDYQKAAETYHTLSNIKPIRQWNIRSFYHAAAAFHKSNQPNKVNAVLDEADTALASINRRDDMSLIGALATICFENEMFDSTIKLAEKSVSEAETSGDGWGLRYLYEILAKSYLGAKRYEDAFKTYQKMANVDSSSRHRAETGMKEAAKAGKLYERWIPEQLKQVTENPNDPEHILKLAQSYEAIEKTKEAITQYERLAELEPGNPQWHTKLGTLYQNLPQENRETGTGTEELNTKLSAKSINAYRKAIELERNSYQLYDLLAQTYLKVAQTSQAEAMYRHALDASLTQSDYDAAVRAIIRLYTADGQENTQIAILEEFKPRMDKSAVLHELLGDLYKKVGNSEKAELAYDKWLQIRQKELNIAQSASYYRNFAEKLLDKALYPETALFYAKRAFYKNTYYADDYFLTLGRACVANGLYDEALNHFKHALSLMFDEHYDEQYIDMLWEDIAEAIKIANDKERYIQMLNTLIDSMPAERSNAHAIIYHIIADFYAENETPAYVENYLLKTGFVPETSWITLGPFDNKDTIGLFTAYIPEETTQIDTAAQYYGKDKLIRWRKPDDGKRNGMIWLGSDIDWTAAYAWTIVSSPDEREITIRFDSDDQGIIWLNGIEVFRHDRMGGARVDRYTVPVTLKQGENTILIKVCNATLHTCFFMRLTDMHGNPFKDLKFNNADDLLNTLPPKPTFHVNVNLGLAEYYSKNNMPEKAMELMRQTGMLHENTWLVLGPYDNTAGIGYNTEYIPENTTQIDLTAKYDGVDEQISWKKFTDDAFDGF
ncbi:hypothetical protein F4083_05800, partial [Candidatus Poribacteria bacterium]|nr:hypothetical protein [Candidatus Poribacteria bacterium]